jgi:membrane fusion protein (multidrug efflux system)
MRAMHSPKRFITLVISPIALCALASCQKQEAAKVAPPVPEVLVIDAGTKDVPVYREWIGTLDGSENADIRARVTGHLLKRNYQEGSFVKKGDVLFEIDPRPFEAALAEAESQLNQGRAVQLASQAEAERSKQLFDKKVIAESEHTNKIQLNLSNVAKVKALEAAVEQARLNLEFCKIVSPVDGIAGISKAQVGDLVGTASSSVLTQVSTLDPLKVIFPVSEEEYLLIGEYAQANIAKPIGERPEVIELILANGKPFSNRARLLSVDRQVNQATGTILVTAVLKNPGSILRPGQFARARVVAQTLTDAVTVPQRAVSEVQGSYQIGVVGPDGKAEIRPVETGPRTGGDWVITSGLKPGEKVVVEGFQKIKSGAPVAAQPWSPPADRAAAPAAQPSK